MIEPIQKDWAWHRAVALREELTGDIKDIPRLAQELRAVYDEALASVEMHVREKRTSEFPQ